MTILTDPMYQAMIRCVISAPDDDGPRLVMADWLEEQGDSDRAEFIRVQCELATMGPSIDIPTDSKLRNHRILTELLNDPECVKANSLRDLERHLWVHNCSKWFLDHPFCTALARRDACNNPCHGFPTRGFISAIASSWGHWAVHADQILAAQPVTEVEIVGPVPIHLVAGGRFRRLGGPRTWRIRNETADFNYGETAYAIVDTLLRKEWPSVKKWRGGPDTFATEEDEGVMPRFASSTLPIEE